MQDGRSNNSAVDDFDFCDRSYHAKCLGTTSYSHTSIGSLKRGRDESTKAIPDAQSGPDEDSESKDRYTIAVLQNRFLPDRLTECAEA